jgi:hypothetical protein
VAEPSKAVCRPSHLGPSSATGTAVHRSAPLIQGTHLPESTCVHGCHNEIAIEAQWKKLKTDSTNAE